MKEQDQKEGHENSLKKGTDFSPQSELTLSLGEIIRSSRVDKGFTLDDLAVRSGKGKGWLSKIENGKAMPNFRLLGRIADALSWDEEKREVSMQMITVKSTEEEKLLQQVMERINKLYGDEETLRNVLLEAIKFTPPSRVVLRLFDDYFNKANDLLEEHRRPHC